METETRDLLAAFSAERAKAFEDAAAMLEQIVCGGYGKAAQHLRRLAAEERAHPGITRLAGDSAPCAREYEINSEISPLAYAVAQDEQRKRSGQ